LLKASLQPSGSPLAADAAGADDPPPGLCHVVSPVVELRQYGKFLDFE
jgi:hypothetical protein